MLVKVMMAESEEAARHLLAGAEAGVDDLTLGVGQGGGLHEVALALHPGVKDGLAADAAHLGGQRGQQPALARIKDPPQRLHITQLAACAAHMHLLLALKQ